MFLSIDRFDGIYAICESDEPKLYAIKKSELPQNAQAGDVLNLSSDGVLMVDFAETEKRKLRIKTLQNKLFSAD